MMQSWVSRDAIRCKLHWVAVCGGTYGGDRDIVRNNRGRQVVVGKERELLPNEADRSQEQRRRRRHKMREAKRGREVEGGGIIGDHIPVGGVAGGCLGLRSARI
jgi:hypothetical protein